MGSMRIPVGVYFSHIQPKSSENHSAEYALKYGTRPIYHFLIEE